MQNKSNTGSQSKKQDNITGYKFIGVNGHGCLNYIKVYVGMKVIVGTDVYLSMASRWP